MKIAEIAFVMLVFNFCLGIVVHSGITPYPTYYESEIVDTFSTENGSLPGSVSTSSETEQYAITMDVFDLILSVTDFGWLYHLIPDEMDEAFAPTIMGIQAIVGFFYVVALIEFFLRQTELLGSSGGGTS